MYTYQAYIGCDAVSAGAGCAVAAYADPGAGRENDLSGAGVLSPEAGACFVTVEVDRRERELT